MLPGKRLKGRKAKDIYELLFQNGVLSKLQLKEKSRLTGSTLTRMLEELIGHGFILAEDFGESTGGRRPILYRINPHYGYVFGLDISRATSKLVLCDMQLNILDSTSWKMDEKMTPTHLMNEVVHKVRHMIATLEIEEDAILGLGIGAVGPLDRTKGIILNPEHFVSTGWDNVNICEFLHNELNLHCVLDNGANTAILGEYWLETDAQIEHLLYVHAGIGIRSAMIVGGQLVYGAVDMEGAAGQMIIQCEQDALTGGLAEYSSWESRLSSSAYFGVGLANMLNILHPQKVILGGPLISNNSQYYDDATRLALHYTYHAPAYQVIFQKSKLGDGAVAIGAAVMMIKQMTA